MSDYKSVKEAFVSNTTGSTVSHVNLISSTALSSIALYSALRSRLPPSTKTGFVIEWILLVVPLLLSMTLFAHRPVLLSTFLLFPTGLLLLIPPNSSNTPPNGTSAPDSASPSGERRSRAPSPTLAPPALPVAPLPALTTYRAHMMLMTILAILAVDFPVFPRMLAKCETFGVSMMDIGVGSFVFSQGVVSAIPLLKNPGHLSSPLLPKLKTSLLKSLPLWALGFVRVILVKWAEYPEHESEYGTHWNFFLTLAVLPPLQVLLHPFITHVPISLVGTSIVIGHQLSLSLTPLQDFVLNAPRSNVLYKNKEGIFSILGYLGIHILGLSAGTLILPPSPSSFRRRQLQQHQHKHARHCSDARLSFQFSKSGAESRQLGKTAIELCSYSVLWWVVLIITRLSGSEVSRRLANLPYVMWVVAYNTSFLLGYLLLDMLFFPQIDQFFTLEQFPSDFASQPTPPPLLEALNRNGLVVFLLANVATGIVNLSTETVHISDTRAMGILSGYALLVCGCAWLLGEKRVMKF